MRIGKRLILCDEYILCEQVDYVEVVDILYKVCYKCRALNEQDICSFAFLLWDEGICRGMCHGDYFNTFWMSGLTCYVSSLITREEDRGKGYGVALLDHAKELAKQRGCKAITLDSGLPRTGAHGFYEHYGFEKSCYGFELMI